MLQTKALAELAVLPVAARTREVVDGWIERHRPFPVVEDKRITFVWRGDADAVHLKHWVYGLPSSQQLARLDGTNVWHLTFELPHGSRVEYKFEVVRNGRGEWTEDPFNPNRARDPFGANSVAQGFGYETPDWIQPDPEAKQGVTDEIVVESKVFGRRGVGMYLPARYRRNRRYPLLVVHDGHDYVRYASLKIILDNLIHRREIPDMVVALTSSPHRLGEYADDPRHATFIATELVPLLETRMAIEGRAQGRCLMGASFGAVASLTTAWRHPGMFGKLLLQSGSFAFTDIGDRNHRGPLFDPIVQFMNRFRADPQPVSERIFITVGTYESLIYENRSLVPLLRSTGMEVRYTEARDGHNWENWRDRLREGLSWLFPGPLLLVYE
jgi:enterochelin esterase-like enzyme